MQPKLLLPVVAAALLALAIGGIAGGVGLQTDEPSPTPAAAPETAGAASGGQPEAAQEFSLVRFGVRTPPAKPEGAIRLATYNVANLFDEIDDPALSGRNEDIDDAKPEAELRALAQTIQTLDADILALQEIESGAVITWFRDAYIPDAGYAHLLAIDAGDERGIEQVLLSRYPITDSQNWPRRDLGGTHPPEWGSGENWNAGEPIRFHRSPLRATVEVDTGDGAYELTLYIVHCKSGGPGEYWRQAEAAGLVEILGSSPLRETNIAILGDFNAMLSAPSVRTILGAGFVDALAPVATTGPAFVTHESGRRIDHILVNGALAAELAPGTGFVLGTPALPEGADWRDPWRPDGYASDHYPVAVDLFPRDASSED